MPSNGLVLSPVNYGRLVQQGSRSIKLQGIYYEP